MNETTEQEASADLAGRANNDLLTAEAALAVVTTQMAADYKLHGKTWPRKWMQKHVIDRQTLIKVRNILLDRAGI